MTLQLLAFSVLASIIQLVPFHVVDPSPPHLGATIPVCSSFNALLIEVVSVLLFPL